MVNDYFREMMVLINCKELVEDLVAERKYMLKKAECKGDEVRVRTLLKEINRYQSVLDGERYYGSHIRDKED